MEMWHLWPAGWEYGESAPFRGLLQLTKQGKQRRSERTLPRSQTQLQAWAWQQQHILTEVSLQDQSKKTGRSRGAGESSQYLVLDLWNASVRTSRMKWSWNKKGIRKPVMFVILQNRNPPYLASAERVIHHQRVFFYLHTLLYFQKIMFSCNLYNFSQSGNFTKATPRAVNKGLRKKRRIDSLARGPGCLLLFSPKTHRAVRTVTFSTDWWFLTTAVWAAKLKEWWISRVTDFKVFFIFIGGRGSDQYTSVVHSPRDFKGFQLKLTTDSCKSTS